MEDDRASFLQEGWVVLQRVPGGRREVSESACPCGGVAQVLDVLGGTDIRGRQERAREDAERVLSMLWLGQGWGSWCCNPPATGCCKHGGHHRGPWRRWPHKVLGLLRDNQAAPADIWGGRFPLSQVNAPKITKRHRLCSKSEQREKKIKNL